MKKLSRNIFILFITTVFCAGNFSTEIVKAQTKTPVGKIDKTKQKSSSDTKPVKSSVKSDSSSKTTGKTTSATDKNGKLKSKESKPKLLAAAQIIVSATSARVRQKPDTNSKVLDTLKIGTILTVLDKNSAWYQVKLFNNGGEGWISKTIASDFDNLQRDEIYRKIVEKYYKNNSTEFITASQLADFLKSKNDLPPDLKFKRLIILSTALKKIPVGKSDQNPYKSFTEANEREIVYSEPSAQWNIRSEVFWELQSRYKNLPVGEEIAWQAAQTPLPGECEGYVICYLYNIRATDGEYLNFYPNGKYSKKALQNITYLLEPIVADLRDKAVYTAASDISDRAEFNRYLAELRKIISKIPLVEKSKALNQISQLGEGYR